MATFLQILEPTIVRGGVNSSIPENLQGRYMVMLNLLNINGFNYIKQTETGYDMDGTGSTGSGSDMPVIKYNSFPAIFIDINDSFVESDAALQQLFFAANQNPSVFLTGVTGFEIGKDYYINDTLYTFLLNTARARYSENEISLPDYYDADWNVTQYWDDLSDDPYRYAVNIKYFWKRNALLDFVYSEDELNNFYSTFMSVILYNTLISDDLRASDNNPIYNQVLNFYKNFQSDCASSGIGLILGSLYGNSTSTSTSCGCNSDLNENGNGTLTCSELYNNAMETYLKQMLGDAQFYKDWLMIPGECEDEYLPNDVVIDALIELINEFIAMENSLQFAATKNKNCDCPVVNYDESECNYKIIEQYLKVLGYCKDNEIDANVNKIKVYGSAFAEILPKLIF